MANNHSSAFLCYQAASENIEGFQDEHRNIIVDYKKVRVATPLTTTGAICYRTMTHIEYGCSKYGVGKVCPECKRAKKFVLIDMVLIPVTLGGWWLLGNIVTRTRTNSDLVGITREAALKHSRIEKQNAVYSTDGSQYEYNSRMLNLYSDPTSGLLHERC